MPHIAIPIVCHKRLCHLHRDLQVFDIGPTTVVLHCIPGQHRDYLISQSMRTLKEIGA